MTANLVVDLPATTDYVPVPFQNRPIHQLSDGSYVVVAKSTTNTITVYHSPDKVTWTSRGTITVDSWHGNAKQYAVAIAANNDLHVCWINSTSAIRYVKMTYTAGTPTWAAGAAETASAAPGGSVTNETPAIEVLDSGVIVVSWLRSPTSGTTDLSARVRCRSSAGAWGVEQNIGMGLSGPFERVGIINKLARDAGGASGGVQKCWLMCTGGATTEYTHRVLAVTIATGNFTLTTPPTPISLGSGSVGDWGTVFSHAADRWRFAGYKPGASGTQSTLYVAEASSTAVIHTSTKANVFGQHQTDLTLPYAAKVMAFYLPDRIVFVGAGQGMEASATAPPFLTMYAFIIQDGVFRSTARLVQQIGGGMTNSLNNANTYVVGGDDNRNQSGTEHCILVFEQTTDKLIAFTVTAPTETGAPVLIPAAGATVNTDVPTLSRSIVPAGNIVEWGLAEDAGFTVNAKTVIEPVSYEQDVFPFGTAYNFENIASTHSEKVPAASMLRQALWHMRSRLVNIVGQASAWIATQTFTVAHVPSVIPNQPTGGQIAPYGATNPFAFTFSDTSEVDNQSAYQVVVERNSDGAAVADTGKVVSAATSVNIAISSGFKDTVLRWKVRVWDSDDVASAYSSYELFQVSDPPTISITSPADGGTVDNPAPLITWSFVTSGGRTQYSYRVEIYDSAGALIHTSGTVQNSTANSYQVPQSLLVLGGVYTFIVKAYDTSITTGQAIDTNVATATWTPPAAPTGVAASATNFDTLGFTTVAWNNSPRDVDFYGWRVYRRVSGDTGLGVLIFETTSALANSFDDWTVASGVQYEYNVVQVANRFGVLVESPAGWTAAIAPSSSYYWLIHPDDSTKNIRLILVVSDDYTDEYESETHNLPGRGRKTDYGTHWGKVGSMTCQVYDTPTKTARQIREEIFAIKDELTTLFLRNPFGDVWQVTVGDLGVSRLAGVGTREFVTLTIPYTEVA